MESLFFVALDLRMEGGRSLSVSVSAGLDTTVHDRKVLVWSWDPDIRVRAPLAGLGVAKMYHLLCDV